MLEKGTLLLKAQISPIICNNLEMLQDNIQVKNELLISHICSFGWLPKSVTLTLSDNSDKLCRDFVRKLLNLSNCIRHLLPPPRDTEITSRLRRATTYLRPHNRTNCYKSFIHYALPKYQWAYSTLLGLLLFFSSHFISFLVLYCRPIVLLYIALSFA